MSFRNTVTAKKVDVMSLLNSLIVIDIDRSSDWRVRSL